MNTSSNNNLFQNTLQQNSFGTLEAPKTIPGLTQLKEDLNNFAQEVDRQMQDIEARVVCNVSQQFEEQFTLTNQKIDEALLLLDQRVSKLQQQVSSPAAARPNVVQSSQITEDGRINPAKMEQALNDWLSKVEEQVIEIEDKVNGRAALGDL